MRTIATLGTVLALALPAASTAAQDGPSNRASVAKRLNRALAATPMRGTGWKLEQAGYTHRISPYFIAAIAATESSLGRAACRSNRHNAFGLASCGHSWPVPQFRSWAQAYQFMGAFLRRRWPQARTAYEFYGYAACSSCWGRKTAYWMRRLFGVGPEVRYPSLTAMGS